MSLESAVVTGEAAETDSEEEIPLPTANKTGSPSTPSANVQGEVINGEDSESDTDTGASEVKENANEKATTRSVHSPTIKPTYTSLLHRKLNENNCMVHKSLNSFFANKVNDATTSLNGTDRQLMKSQLTLQGALNSLRLLNAHSSAIKTTLRNILVEDNYLDTLVT